MARARLLLVLVVGASTLLPVTTASAGCNDRRRAPDPPVLTPGRAQLQPRTIEVSIPAGKTVAQEIALTLPAAPTPLDVFFLIDTTGSMEDVICGVRTGLTDIAIALWKQGIDVYFGVGEFRDYSPPQGTGDFAYRLRRAIGPPDQELLDILMRMQVGNGGDEPSLTALYQAATGEGEDTVPPGNSPGDVEPGGAAGFRSDALKIIIHVTDERFRRPSSGLGPTWEETTGALLARDITTVAISVGADPWSDLVELQRRMGIRAPAGGVDCDGDGRTDLDRGDPLVCLVRRTQSETLPLAPTILALLDAVRDDAPVALSPAGELRAVERISPSAPVLDLREDNQMTYRVLFSCADLPPGTVPVDLNARIRGDIVATARAAVTCEAPPALPAALIAAGPAATAPQTPAQQPAPQSQPQVQPNPGANPNAAMVPAMQENPALATQLADGDAAFSRRRDEPTAGFAAAAALMAMVALWFGRTQPVLARIRPRRRP